MRSLAVALVAARLAAIRVTVSDGRAQLRITRRGRYRVARFGRDERARVSVAALGPLGRFGAPARRRVPPASSHSASALAGRY